MILKITAYGDPLLRKESTDIDASYPALHQLITDMYETMNFASGVGLAAPQVGLNINLFIVDTTKVDNYNEGIKKVFINPEILDEYGKIWTYEEGCLSLPKLRENVDRYDTVKVRYLDENFIEHTDVYTNINGRVIQHEYDHLMGVVFIDHITAFRKRLVRKKLDEIVQGKVDAGYPVRFYNVKKR